MASNLGLFRKLAYSSGNLGTMLIGELAVMWIIFFYTPFAPVLLLRKYPFQKQVITDGGC